MKITLFRIGILEKISELEEKVMETIQMTNREILKNLKNSQWDLGQVQAA